MDSVPFRRPFEHPILKFAPPRPARPVRAFAFNVLRAGAIEIREYPLGVVPPRITPDEGETLVLRDGTAVHILNAERALS